MGFDLLLKGDVASYLSRNFSYEGEIWYFCIWPNGSEKMCSNEYINVRVLKYKSNNPPIRMEISFSLKTVNGEKDSESRCTEVFHGWSYHDFYRFFSRSDLERRRSEFLDSGYLTLICTLKKMNATSTASNVAIEACSYCKKSFDVLKLPSHEKKCRVKYPECLDVILLQDWDKHECQTSRAEGKALLTESSKILEDFKELFLKQIECDVLIRVKDQEFSAHRAILIARSPVFESTFRNDMKEKATGAINIEDCDPSSFSEFLHFLYCADADTIPEGKVFSLFVTADKYDVSDLKLKCIEFMKENLSIDTICETITLALQYSETELLNLATDFFIKESEKIIKTVKWQTFLVENPIQANELFIKALSNAKHPKI